MSLIYFNICLLVLIFQNTEANKIKLQIETDDLMKLLNVIMKTEMFKGLAAEIIQRSATKKNGAYNNPYHPEDDTITNNNSEDKEDQKFKNLYPFNKETKIVESKLEKENDNYVLAQDNKSAEKQSSYSKEKTLVNESRKHNGKEKVEDMHNFKRMQKRFELKKS